MPIFLALNGGAVLVALVLAREPGAPPSRRLLRALSGYLVTVHSVVLLAGLLGRLAPAGLAAILAGVLVATWWRRRGGRPADAVAAPRLDGTAEVGVARPTVAFVMLLACGAGALWAWPHLAGPTRLWVWDDYTYHMVYPVSWLSMQAIAAPGLAQAFTMQAWYPLSASVVATWFMAPFPASRGEALAWVGLTGPLYAGIAASAAAEVLGRLGCRRGAWALPVVLFATSDRIDVMASSFSDADLAQAVALFAALAFAVPRGAAETASATRADACFAALLTGFAIGVKASALPAAVVVLLVTMVRARTPGSGRAGTMRAAARPAVVFLASWTVTAGYWYARNLVHTGNPVYPAAFLLWPGATFPETTLVEYAARYGMPRTIADALAVYANWPRFHGLAAAGGLVALAAWAAVRWRQSTRPQRHFACGALAIAGTLLVLLPATPYSAGNAMTFRSGFVHWDSMRYVAILPLLGWTALGFLVDAGAGVRRSLTAAAIATAGVLASGTAADGSAIALGVLAVCAVPAVRLGDIAGRWLARRARAWALAAGALAIVTAGLLAVSHGGKGAAMADAVHREPLIGAAAAVLDREQPGTRVAVYGDQWIYPAFGAFHHLEPVRLDGDGRPASGPIGAAMEPGALRADPAAFRANLAASGVGLVVIVRQPHPGRSGEWPAQHAALEALGDARLLHRDRAVAVWRLGS
jgi:hypothetical protein